MDARYLYAIAIGIMAGIALNIAFVISAIIALLGAVIVPIFPLGLGVIEAIALFLFLVVVGAYTTRLIWKRYGADGIKEAAVAGLTAGIIGQILSLMTMLLFAIAVAIIGAVGGYYLGGSVVHNPWLSAAAFGLGGFVLASIYSVCQFLVFTVVYMMLALVGGFAYIIYKKNRVGVKG